MSHYLRSVVAPLLACGLSAACPLELAPPVVTEERPELSVTDVVAQRAVSDVEAAAGRVFIIVTLTVTNAGDVLLFVDPAQFSLENADGTVVGANAAATAALAAPCSRNIAAVAGRSVTCSVAFENDEGQIPSTVRFVGAQGIADTAALSPLSLGLQCLFFIPPSPVTQCYGNCIAANCDLEVNAFLGSCEMCFPQCGDNAQACFCVTESCGPECAGSSADFDRCASACVDACF